MAAKTKEKETVVVKTQEEMYLDAERLLKATECLTRDKEKAEFFKNLADRYKDLGVTGLYFCPITMGHTNHRYDTIDYMKIDPHLGDKKTLKKLVKEAHKRGMKIMLDAVFNHIGYYSKQWQDVIKNKEKSKYKDWFYIKDINKVDIPLNKIDSKNIPYETFSCVAEMPKLNTENEEVIEYYPI